MDSVVSSGGSGDVEGEWWMGVLLAHGEAGLGGEGL